MLEKRNRKLLYELDANYRRPSRILGKKIRMSEQLVSYTINSFLKKGILLGFYPLIDYSRSGYLSFIVCFKVYYLNHQSFTSLIKKLQEHPQITSIIECDGKYDLLLVFHAKNPSSFNKTLKRLISDNSELRNYMILTSVVEHHYLRNYLLGKHGEDDTVI